MAEYRNLVKSYIELTDEFDERRIRLEGMQANIEKVKAETKSEKSEGGNKTIILTCVDEMRKVLEAKKARDENDDG